MVKNTSEEAIFIGYYCDWVELEIVGNVAHDILPCDEFGITVLIYVTCFIDGQLACEQRCVLHFVNVAWSRVYHNQQGIH